ncbi:MAG: hypothetical protein GYA55_04015, partial [SAR324 cluster bacterium]|nr:hypothetical protein [SAR324 cluster bacterium]
SWYYRWKDDPKVVKLDIGDGIYSYSDAYNDDPNSTSDMYVGTLLNAIGMRQDQFVYFAQNAMSLSCEYATNPNAEANLYSAYDQYAATKWDLFLSAAKHWTVDVVPVY